MMLLAFSLFDNKVASYSPPFFMNHVGAAIRAVMELADDQRTTVGRHPADFTLMSVGSFDDSVGVFIPSPPEVVAAVTALLRPQPGLPLDNPSVKAV